MINKYGFTKEWLSQKYIVEDLTQTEISKIKGCQIETVSRWLKKFDIPIAPRSSKYTKYKISKEYLIEEYANKKLTMNQISKNLGCGSTTIEKRLKKYGIPIRSRGFHMTHRNPMKNPETRKKVSDWRRAMPKDIREKYAATTRKAWKDGKLNSAATGRCSWFDYATSSGVTIKCQGTWELAFAKWMDEEGMKFNAHRGRISYEMDGKSRSYYPDFYVHDWECYVDVKAKYFADLQEKKFKAIRKSNPKLKLKILLKEDMLKLGVSF